jgi:hypothetical protein
MSRRAAIAVAVMVVLTIVNALWPRSPSPLTSSSFGRAGAGHGALYDLLSETGLSRGRSFEAARRLDDAGTLWWIDPAGVCDGRIARSGMVDVLDAEDVAWPAAAWLRSGGVGVVFLQSADPGGPVLAPQDELVECDAIGGMALPGRVRLRAASEATDEADADDDAEDAPSDAAPPTPTLVEGSFASQPRRLPLDDPWVFEESSDWPVVARARKPDGPEWPFVLARPFGEGLLVVVADSGFTHNAWLDGEDAAPFAVDLVRSFGEPRFDEREHGFLPETSAFRYIASSAALPVYVGLALLGVLHAWRGNALPARSVPEFDPATPTLETYVTSMAALYAGTRDHARVLERYRELTASRLKRHFGLPQEVSRRALAERIERDRQGRPRPGAGRAPLAVLTEPRSVGTEAELASAVGELDALVSEVIH